MYFLGMVHIADILKLYFIVFVSCHLFSLKVCIVYSSVHGMFSLAMYSVLLFMKFILPEKQGMPGVGFQLLVFESKASILSIPSILLKQPGLLNPPDTMIDLLRIDKLGCYHTWQCFTYICTWIINLSCLQYVSIKFIFPSYNINL